MELTQAKAALMELQSKMSAYGHAMSIISYDGVTYAPSATAENRAHTLGVLSAEMYTLTTGKETVALLEVLDAQKTALDAREQRMVELLLHSIRQMQAIPMDEYVAYQELLVKADDVWHKAKETSDFALFAPYLKEIFATSRRFAGYIAPDKDPYDYYLNEFEDGLNREKCDAFFAALRERIVPLLGRIMEKEPADESCIRGDFEDSVQEKFGYYLMDVCGVDRTHCTLATTEHPFTTSFGSHYDVRITTNYDRDNLSGSMYSVIHEGGHAMYDMGSKDEFAYTALDGGVSMGIHESQSRFYENILGRSRAFIGYIFPKMQEFFPDTLRGRTAEDVYRAVNSVKPSLIRTDADEVTYCLHVLVRYELEKRVMAGELAVEDLPREWNRLYKEIIGVDVPDDKHGVLQDSHWSGGMVGYFPSYALGSAYGAQFYRKMCETVDVETCLKKGDFAPINAWNRENIWQWGSFYKPGALLDRVLGEPFDPMVYVEYLEKKYTELYAL